MTLCYFCLPEHLLTLTFGGKLMIPSLTLIMLYFAQLNYLLYSKGLTIRIYRYMIYIWAWIEN